MSESSSELGAAGRTRSVDELVERLRAKTLAERLPLLAHLSIGRTLCKLRDAITNDGPVSAKAAKALLCCGVAMYRRHAVGEQADEEGEDHEETMALIKQSSVLIFVLLATIEARSSGGAVDAETAREVVERANGATLAGVLEVRSARRKRKAPAHEADKENEGDDDEHPPPPPPAASAGALSMSLLQHVAHMLRERASKEHERLADMFFRTSAACMAQNLLLAHGASDFVSLRATADHPVPREERLTGIAQAGESEAGQSARPLSFEPTLSPRTHAYLPPGAQSARSCATSCSPSCCRAASSACAATCCSAARRARPRASTTPTRSTRRTAWRKLTH
jgi:hypothetical protein